MPVRSAAKELKGACPAGRSSWVHHALSKEGRLSRLKPQRPSRPRGGREDGGGSRRQREGTGPACGQGRTTRRRPSRHCRLSALGIRSIILTGDNRRTAGGIAKSSAEDFRAELMPDDKLKFIRDASPRRSKRGPGRRRHQRRPRPWQKRTSVSPWVVAQMSRWRRRMPRSSTTMSRTWPGWSNCRGGRWASSGRTSSWRWASRGSS